MDIIRRFHDRMVLVGALLYLTVTVALFPDSVNMGTAASIIAFTSFVAIIQGMLNREERFFTAGKLFGITTIYSTLIVLTFWWLSMYYDNDTYLFSKADALIYRDFCLYFHNKPITEMFSYLWNNVAFEEWGAIVPMTMMWKIVPNKLFINLIYILLGGATSLILFRTAQRFISTRLAFIASLAYSISSFTIYYHGTFLKETMFICFVALLFNSFSKYAYEHKPLSLLPTIIYSAILCAYRPVTVMIIWFGFFIYFICNSRHNKKMIIAVVAIIIVAIASFASFEQNFIRFTEGGDITKILSERRGAGPFMYLFYAANYFTSLFGPMPDIIGIESRPFFTLLGPGLLYRLALNLPFWLAVWHIVKNGERNLYPIVIFIIIESFLAAVVQKGFEIRINMPHMALLYMIAFWYFDKISSYADNQAITQSEMEENKETAFFRKALNPTFITIAIIVIAWAIIRSALGIYD